MTVLERKKNVSAPRSVPPTLTWDFAMRQPADRKWTEEEYLECDSNSEPRLVELDDGFLEFLPMPDMLHQDIAQFLFLALFEFVVALKTGRVYIAPLPVKLWAKQFREPDVLYLATHRIKDKRKPPEGADLAMEVMSPGTKNRERDLKTKRRVYAKAGISEYWIVDPKEKTITVLTLAGKSYKAHGIFEPGETAASKLLKGFKVAVADVFAAGEGK